MPGLAGARVLVVEGEFVIAVDHQVLLWRFGCEVLGPMASAAEVLVLLRHERPDAALLDVGLADGQAVPVAEALRAAGVPFVLVTGRGPGRAGAGRGAATRQAVRRRPAPGGARPPARPGRLSVGLAVGGVLVPPGAPSPPGGNSATVALVP